MTNIYRSEIIDYLTEDINKMQRIMTEMSAYRQELILESEAQNPTKMLGAITAQAATVIKKALSPDDPLMVYQAKFSEDIFTVIKGADSLEHRFNSCVKILVIMPNAGAKYTLFNQVVRSVKGKLSGLNIKGNKITFLNTSSITVITSTEDYNSEDYGVIYTLPNID